MPNPVPLHRHLPSHLAAPPARAPETDADRRERQLQLTRELTDLNMLAARDAAHRIASRDPEAPLEGPATADPTLALARATRAVTLIMNHENRIAAGERATPFTIDDPRGLMLRQLFQPLIANEPDPVRRRAIRTRVNDRIDDALAADLDDNLPLAQIAEIIAKENGLKLDITKIPDAFLGPPDLAASPEIVHPRRSQPTAAIRPLRPPRTRSPRPKLTLYAREPPRCGRSDTPCRNQHRTVGLTET